MHEIVAGNDRQFPGWAPRRTGRQVDMFLSSRVERHLAYRQGLHDRIIAEGEGFIDRKIWAVCAGWIGSNPWLNQYRQVAKKKADSEALPA